MVLIPFLLMQNGVVLYTCIQPRFIPVSPWQQQDTKTAEKPSALHFFFSFQHSPGHRRQVLCRNLLSRGLLFLRVHHLRADAEVRKESEDLRGKFMSSICLKLQYQI